MKSTHLRIPIATQILQFKKYLNTQIDIFIHSAPKYLIKLDISLELCDLHHGDPALCHNTPVINKCTTIAYNSQLATVSKGTLGNSRHINHLHKYMCCTYKFSGIFLICGRWRWRCPWIMNLYMY